VFINVYLHGDINLDPLVTQIENLSDLLGASVVIIYSDFRVLFSGLPGGSIPPIECLEPIMEGESIIIPQGSFQAEGGESLLIAGHPIVFANRVIGAVLVSVSMAELEAAISSMYQITIISLILAALLASILIYFSSETVIRPIRQMNKAAKVIAGGVFENRIPVKTKDEIGQLATQFNTMAESLYNQEQIRRAFISNISHDIRTPLTSMLGFMKAIKDGTAPREKHEYYLDIALTETKRLIKLSNDLLDIHRIQDKEFKLELTHFNINELIRTTIMGFEERVIQKQITVTSRFANQADMVYADKDIIQRCLYNLLDNAIKFTPIVGEITIETTNKGKKIQVSIKDNGCGMTKEEQLNVFDRFFKGDQSRNEDKGSGLGLSIVKEFIRAHGEAITLESIPKKGSTFAFTLTTVEEESL